MKKTATWLLDHAAVKELGGTNYMEICRGAYGGQCWRQDSVYVYCALWEDFFDTVARECIPGYDFFEFTDVAPEHGRIFAAQLLNLAARLAGVQTLRDFDRPEWHSQKAKSPYIRIGANIETQLLANKDAYLRQFSANFAEKMRIAAQSYRDLAGWLQRHSANGNALLGM